LLAKPLSGTYNQGLVETLVFLPSFQKMNNPPFPSEKTRGETWSPAQEQNLRGEPVLIDHWAFETMDKRKRKRIEN
jgi:hypothetical protein